MNDCHMNYKVLYNIKVKKKLSANKKINNITTILFYVCAVQDKGLHFTYIV